ncbi:type III toxin-antitoxin system CptIN family toxin [Bacillales bacterium AN1005]
MEKDNIKQHYIYKIKDEYFEKFPDPHLLYNKGENRPNYYVFEGDNKNILWFVPLSSQTEKWESILEDRKQKGKPTDIAHVCQVGPKKQAFVIQDMFPITKDYIRDEYFVRRQPYYLANPKDIKIVEDKAQKIYDLIKHGVKFTRTPPNTKSIEQELVKSLPDKELEKDISKNVNSKDETNEKDKKEQRDKEKRAAMRRHLAMRER